MCKGNSEFLRDLSPTNECVDQPADSSSVRLQRLREGGDTKKKSHGAVKSGADLTMSMNSIHDERKRVVISEHGGVIE